MNTKIFEQIYTSFIIETCLKIIIFVLFLTLDRWPHLWEPKHGTSTTQESLKDRLVAANCEFYKAQCYLAGAIQIASVVLATQMDWNYRVEYGLFFTLATSGYVPIILNLLCITRHGQSSWSFIILALCCFLLSTAALCFSQWYWISDMAFNQLGLTFGNSNNVDIHPEFGFSLECILRRLFPNGSAGVLVRQLHIALIRHPDLRYNKWLELVFVDRLPDLILVLRPHEMVGTTHRKLVVSSNLRSPVQICHTCQYRRLHAISHYYGTNMVVLLRALLAHNLGLSALSL